MSSSPGCCIRKRETPTAERLGSLPPPYCFISFGVWPVPCTCDCDCDCACDRVGSVPTGTCCMLVTQGVVV